jgi:hypothetical protein
VIESRCGGRGRLSAPVQTGPGAHPASYIRGIGSLVRVKQLQCGVYRPPPPGVEVKEGLELY